MLFTDIDTRLAFEKNLNTYDQQLVGQNNTGGERSDYFLFIH